MLTLAINTATSLTSIALLEEQKLLGEDSWKSNNDEAEKLMPAISNLFKKNKKDFSGIKKVIVIKGPGSFTGLRVGVTIANTIAILFNIGGPQHKNLIPRQQPYSSSQVTKAYTQIGKAKIQRK